ncbi:hypothetical protein D3C85_1537030 [compost metagenome]
MFVAVFFLDVLAHGFTQPFKARRQARPARHHQWHGVAHVIVGLRQEGPVTFQADFAFEGVTDDGQIEQLMAFVPGRFL